MTSYRADKPNFVEFWVKMAKITLKVKVNDLNFQYQPRVFHDACLVQIWWFQLKCVMSYRADKVKFTDRQTNRRTDGQTLATTITLRPERPRGKKHATRRKSGGLVSSPAFAFLFQKHIICQIFWMNAKISYHPNSQFKLELQSRNLKSEWKSEIFWPVFKHFHSRKCNWKCRLWNGVHFVSASMC